VPLYPVSSKKIEVLQQKIKKLGLRESDFEETFLRSSGAGGQNVNKVSTCVWVRHLPTGLAVKCQRERSQGLNRFLAKRLLVEKIEVLHLGEQSRKRSEIEKIRRQKRRRSKRAKEKLLKAKRERSEIKSLRKKVHDFYQ